MIRNLPERCVALYFNSWWLPGLVFLILLGGFTSTEISNWTPAIMDKVLVFAAGLAFLGLIAASAWNLLKERWTKGVINVVLVFVCGAITNFAFGFLVDFFVFGQDQDGFADNLEIPSDVQIVEPGKQLDARPGTERDAFQSALLAALQKPGSGDTTISGSVSTLLRLQESDRPVLLRYLASSPAWRVFEEHGKVFATRRWIIGSQWRYNLNGYYTLYDIDIWSKSGIPDFQTRFSIGLSGKPRWRGNKDTTWLKAGETKKAKLSTGNQMDESHCVISAGTTIVEVFEQSGAPERRLTKAALSFLQTELQPLADNPSWETARQMLPPDSIRRGKPSLEIRNSFQPGIYDSTTRLNPGEPGMVYLKAFEVTKGTPLSVEELKTKSNEWIGWSNDPEELFFSNTSFTIYEGDWGKPYAARLEVWFTPNSGGPDRKLIEKVFKIEGWQR
jgi:hypothetical protein